VPGWKARWNELLYEPDGDVLRNKLDLRDLQDLRTADYRIGADRQREIERGDVQIPRTFGADHMQAIHRHLFQDVYDWAGELRDVNLVKAKPFAHHADVGAYLDKVQRLCQAKDWPKLSREEFAKGAAEVYAYLNLGHPFREGNGRATKMFLNQLAEGTPYRLDFDKVDKFTWNSASLASRPEKPWEVVHPELGRLEEVFDTITVERNPGSAASDPELAKAMALQNSTYAANRPAASTRGAAVGGPAASGDGVGVSAGSAGASTSSPGSSVSSTASASSSEASANSPWVQAPAASGMGERPQTHGAAAHRSDRGSGRGE
jgi:cell filamentation protein